MKRFVFLTPMKEWNIISCKMFNTKDVYVHDNIKAINKEKNIFEHHEIISKKTNKIEFCIFQSTVYAFLIE